MKTEKDVREMTAETVGKDLLQAMLAELRLLPKPWDQLPSGKQDDVIDGEVLGLPKPGDTAPAEAELDEYFDAGYQAAKEGKPVSDCPIVRAELVAQWMSGYKSRKDDEANGD